MYSTYKTLIQICHHWCVALLLICQNNYYIGWLLHYWGHSQCTTTRTVLVFAAYMTLNPLNKLMDEYSIFSSTPSLTLVNFVLADPSMYGSADLIGSKDDSRWDNKLISIIYHLKCVYQIHHKVETKKAMRIVVVNWVELDQCDLRRDSIYHYRQQRKAFRQSSRWRFD